MPRFNLKLQLSLLCLLPGCRGVRTSKCLWLISPRPARTQPPCVSSSIGSGGIWWSLWENQLRWFAPFFFFQWSLKEQVYCVVGRNGSVVVYTFTTAFWITLAPCRSQCWNRGSTIHSARHMEYSVLNHCTWFFKAAFDAPDMAVMFYESESQGDAVWHVVREFHYFWAIHQRVPCILSRSSQSSVVSSHLKSNHIRISGPYM